MHDTAWPTLPLTPPVDLLAAAGGPPAASGVVHLVGAGPGDAGLLTTRAARLLSTADVVAHDKLVPAEVLALVPRHAELVDVGRRADGPYVGRDAVDALLLERARAGLAVVRCKGGDPYVFGRGAEEAGALEAAGVAVEVVPGISSAVAVPGAAGIPVTLRGVSPGFAVVTGHEDPTKPSAQVDLDALAAFPGTVVVLMGVRALPRLCAGLVAAGRDPSTPAAVVARGTWHDQVLVDGTLADLAARAAAVDVPTPAVVVVGDVVAHRLGALDRATRPLHGVRVRLPRLTEGPSRLAAALRHAGAQVLEPVVATTGPGDRDALVAAARACVAGRVDTVVVPSTSAWDVLVGALRSVGADVRALAGVAVWVTGRRTAERLAAAGVVAERVVDGPAALVAAPGTPGRALVLAADGEDRGVAAALVASVVTTSTTTLHPLDADDGAVTVVAASRLAGALAVDTVGVVALGATIRRALADRGVACSVSHGTDPSAVVEAVGRAAAAREPVPTRTPQSLATKASSTAAEASSSG